MRFLRLDLLAFGPFTSVSLPLGEGEYGLHIIYGENEAGKSSALRGLTHLLYGIPHNSKDNFIHPYQNMRIGAAMRGINGEVLRCIRRKGRKGTLRADDDADVVDEQRLAEMLGGVNETTFLERFGIDYDELRRGGEAIVAGRGDLGEILFAAGAGVADLGPLQARFDADAEDLFKGRAQTPRLNMAIRELTETRREVKLAQLPREEWVRHTKALQAAEARKAEINGQLVEQKAARRRLERIAEAVPFIARRARMAEDLEAVADAPVLPAEFADQRRDATAQLAAARRAEEEGAAAIDEFKEAIAGLEVPESILEHRTAIGTLHTDLGSYQKAARDRPNLELKRQHAVEEAQGILRELDWEEKTGESDRPRLSNAQRVNIQTLGNEFKAVLAKDEAAREQVRGLREDIARTERKLDEMDAPVDASDLQAAVRRAQQQGDLDEQLLRAGGELQRIEEQSEVDLQRLPLWTGTIENLEMLAVPVAETIEQYDSRMAEATNRMTVVDERLEEHRGRWQAIGQELEQLKLEHDVPTEEDLAAAREQRDQSWTQVRRAWLDGVIDIDPHDLAQAFEANVQAADRIADRLRGEAESVASKAKLMAQQQEEQKRVGELKAEATKARVALESLGESWRGVWTPLGIEPLTPREMRSWSAQHADLVRLAATGRQQRMDVRQLQTLIDSHRQELNECLTRLRAPVAAEDDCLSAVVQRCEDLISRAEAEANERRALRRELESLNGRLPGAEREAERAGEALKRWQDQWSRAVECVGLDQDAGPGEANTVLNAIEELTAKLTEADNLRERIDGIQSEAVAFAERVASLTGQIAPDLSPLSVEQAVADLHDRLSEAQKAQAQREELEKQLDREELKRDKVAREIGRLEAAVEVMCGEAGCDDPDDLPEAERRSGRRQELERDLEKLNEQLAILAAGAALESFIREAESFDPDQLQPIIDSLTEEIAQLDAESSQVSETIGSERTEQRRMDGNARAAEAQEDAERVAAQIRSDAEQYVRLRLASAVLRGAITRYREKNQGPVVERASDLFAELTGGSFEALRADYNDKGEAVLVGVRPGGKLVGVGGFSDGTESQLYLALRLAMLKILAASREPIPFIVDDILKDFDDDRAVAALKALAQLSGQTQVILFTHHNHLVQLAEANLDQDIVFTHVLEPNSVTVESVAT